MGFQYNSGGSKGGEQQLYDWTEDKIKRGISVGVSKIPPHTWKRFSV